MKRHARSPGTGVMTAVATLTAALGVGLQAQSVGALEPSPLNWPQFRGPQALPVSDHPGLPRTWSREENVEWVAEVPGMGWSSPIVWGGKVFLTTAASDRKMKQPSLGVDFSNDYVAEMQSQGLSNEEVERRVVSRDSELPEEIDVSLRLLSIDLATGASLWERELHRGPPPVGRHRKNSYASETPVTDGKAVYVSIAHLGLWAYDFEGNRLWQTPMKAEKVYLDFGGGTSPALHETKLFVQSDNESSSYLAAFDTRTGKRLWRTERTGMGVSYNRSGWSTPLVWRNELRTELVTLGPGFAISYDLDGNELWRMSGLSLTTIASPFAWQEALFLTAGNGREEVKPVVAMRAGGAGELAPPTGNENEYVVWYDRSAGGTYLPTPVIYDGRLYVLTDRGILGVYDARTGRRAFRSRIHREARNFTASPWAYDGAVYMINEEGTTFAVRAGDDFELLAVNRLDEFVQATPALSGDRLLIRTQSRLYSIRRRQTQPSRD